MPYSKFTKQVGGKTKYCLRKLSNGKTYCSDSSAKREKVAKLHEMFAHIK